MFQIGNPVWIFEFFDDDTRSRHICLVAAPRVYNALAYTTDHHDPKKNPPAIYSTDMKSPSVGILFSTEVTQDWGTGSCRFFKGTNLVEEKINL